MQITKKDVERIFTEKLAVHPVMIALLQDNECFELDYNSLYGGYEIHILNKETCTIRNILGFSGRRNIKEMYEFIQVFLLGLNFRERI